MEKLRALTLALLLAAGPAAAQTPFYLGIKGGVSIPNLTAGNGSPVSSGYSSILGPYFGLFAERAFHKDSRWSLQVELDYSIQGGKKNGVQAVPTAPFQAMVPPGTPLPEYLYATYDSKALLDYLQLPVLAKYRMPVGKKWRLTIDAGVYAGYMVHATDKTKGSSNIYFDEAEEQQFPAPAQDFSGNHNITDQINRFNFGIQGGIGLELQCHRGHAFVEAGGNYGFLNIQRYAEDGTNHTGAATVVLGYAFRII